MKNKVIIGIILALVLTLGASFAIFAATSNTPAFQSMGGFGAGLFGTDPSKLTDDQKADINEQFQKMMSLKKDFVNEAVAKGTVSKEQGDAAIKGIDDMIKYHEENGFTPGAGMGMGRGRGNHGFGGGIGCSYRTN